MGALRTRAERECQPDMMPYMQTTLTWYLLTRDSIMGDENTIYWCPEIDSSAALPPLKAGAFRECKHLLGGMLNWYRTLPRPS